LFDAQRIRRPMKSGSHGDHRSVFGRQKVTSASPN
jgi:hypothetical protein